MANLDFFQLYRDIIAIPSISSTDPAWDQSNQQVIQLLADWFGQVGFRCEISAIPEMPGKFNLVATLGQGDGGLLLAGHTDTVPYDEHGWSKDPFKVTEEGNRLYGLGTIDMKGFFAFIMLALQDLDLRQLKQPLRILATADEETTMAGARAIAQAAAFRPQYAVIGEPTGLVPVMMHKGHMSEAIRITGKSGHSSDPANGVNAIEIMQQVLAQLGGLRQSFSERYHNDHFKVPYPTLNFGAIHGGDSPNRICGCCELHIDMRPIPGVSPEELMGLLAENLSGIHDCHPGCLHISHLHEPIPPYACDPASPLIAEAERLSGHTAEAVNYCTEAPFVEQLGCDTLVMGPGYITQAHQPDEYLDLSFVKPTRELLAQLIRRFCF